MGGLEHATPGILLVVVVAVGILFRQLGRAGRGHQHFIRRIPGIDAVEGAIGRSAEMGRSVVFTTALTDVGPVLYACLGVLHSVAKRVAAFKLKLIVPQYSPEAMAIRLKRCRGVI